MNESNPIVSQREDAAVEYWKAEAKRLRAIIARLRCAECGDELGDNWAEVNGEIPVLCEQCGGDVDVED